MSEICGNIDDKRYTREIIRSLVEARLAEDSWLFGTLPDRSKSPSPSKPDFKSRVDTFIKSGKAQNAIHSAASKVISGVQHHHKEILAGAITAGLGHIAHIDMPGDLEEHVHHHLAHLGTSLSISKTMAHSMMKDAVSKLRAARGLKEHDKDYEKDDELDAALDRLHHILKKIEPVYREKPDNKNQPPKVPPKESR
jgi:hypothetical protein